MAASSLAAECTAHVSVQTHTDGEVGGRGRRGGRVVSLLHNVVVMMEIINRRQTLKHG